MLVLLPIVGSEHESPLRSSVVPRVAGIANRDGRPRGASRPRFHNFEGNITSTAKEGSDGHKEREEDLEHEFILLTRSNVASHG
jgi:hypothetical protein